MTSFNPNAKTIGNGIAAAGGVLMIEEALNKDSEEIDAGDVANAMVGGAAIGFAAYSEY